MSRVICDKCRGSGYIGQTALAKKRKSVGLTQEQVANYLGIRRSGYAMIESGKANFTANKIVPLAEVLGITADEVLDLIYAEQGEESRSK